MLEFQLKNKRNSIELGHAC